MSGSVRTSCGHSCHVVTPEAAATCNGLAGRTHCPKSCFEPQLRSRKFDRVWNKKQPRQSCGVAVWMPCAERCFEPGRGTLCSPRSPARREWPCRVGWPLRAAGRHARRPAVQDEGTANSPVEQVLQIVRENSSTEHACRRGPGKHFQTKLRRPWAG